MARQNVLIVDDEKSIRDSLRLLLGNHFEVAVAEGGEAALEHLEAEKPDIILLDMMMPKMDGIATLRSIRESLPAVPVIMLTATNSVSKAVEAMKLGAVDYVSKPFEVDELINVLLSSLEQSHATGKSLAAVTKADASDDTMHPPVPKEVKLIGSSPAMEELLSRIELLAARDTTALITGESGTGKELIARLIHDCSARKRGPFVAINCAAIPETLIESELFGHEKGAFTHAVEKRIGHFENAHGGTLFLDEIGELSPTVQVKMLRFLQEQEFFRVGSSKPTRVDVRILAATNRNLEEHVANKHFREDLYFRINVIHVRVPPLRDRFEDIPALVEHFLNRFSPLYCNRQLSFSEEAMNTLVEYHWPGNVRELENVIESLMALSKTDDIGPDDLPRKLKLEAQVDTLKQGVFSGEMNFEEAEKHFEKELILKALKKTNFVQTRAAELLGISRRILKYKMTKLGLDEQTQ